MIRSSLRTPDRTPPRPRSGSVAAKLLATAKVLATAVAVLPLLLCAAGCRSDGGFGRYDNQRSMDWTATQLEEQFWRDVDATNETFSDLDGKFERHVEQSLGEIESTRALYLGESRYGTGWDRRHRIDAGRAEE